MATLITRLFLALIVGFIATVCAMALLLRVVPREQMDYWAFLAIAVGLVVAAFGWRATRSWKPRRLSPDELATGFDVHLNLPFIVFCVLIAIPSLGLMAIPFWLHSRRFPKRLDPEKMFLRNGQSLSWSDVTDIDGGKKTVGGTPVNFWWKLRAGNATADIVPNSLLEGEGVVEFASRRLGVDLRTN